MTRGLRLVGWTLLFGLFFGVFFLLLDQGVERLAGDRLARARHEASKQRETVERAAVTAARLPEFAAEVKSLEEDLERLGRILPGTPERERLEGDVRSSGARAGVRIIALELGPPEEREFYGVLPLEVEIQGTFGAVDAFCSEVSQQVRRTRPAQMHLERTGDEYSGRLRLEAFYTLPSPE